MIVNLSFILIQINFYIFSFYKIKASKFHFQLHTRLSYLPNENMLSFKKNNNFI
jgi:hypothetical protein